MRRSIFQQTSPMSAAFPLLSERMARIEPFHVMEIQRRAFELETAGRTIIHMEIGQPDFGAPDVVVERARSLLGTQRLGYTDSLGVPALREAIAGHYLRQDGLSIDPGRIMVTTGATGALMTLLATMTNPGDEYLMPDPCYSCNRHLVHLHGGVARLLPTDAGQRFQLTADQVREHWSARTRAVLIASPSNPTGTSIDPDELAGILEVVRERGGILIVDEIYLGLSHGQRPRSALALGDDLFVVNSFSKYFAMTGWRLGWLAAPAATVRGLERLAQNATICPPTLSQLAACAAFDAASLDQCETRRTEFTRRRDLLVPALRDLGFEIPVMPDGAFYVYADCTPLGRSASELARDLLERAGVAATPGLDFGEADPERYIRFAHTCAAPEIERAIERLSQVIRH
jgi:aspartate/methionine/tyrosine aminotransferase